MSQPKSSGSGSIEEIESRMRELVFVRYTKEGSIPFVFPFVFF